jgi:hypothetical protein
MIGDTKFVYLKGKRADFITCLKTSVFSFQPFDMDKFYVKS